MNQPDLGPAFLRVLAAEATCDPRTVRRRLTGKRVASTVRFRLDPVLARHGIVPPEEAPAR